MAVFHGGKKKEFHVQYISRPSLRIENELPFQKCSMIFTDHMLQHCWTISKVLPRKCPVTFTVHTFLWKYWQHSTAVFQKWSTALAVRFFWVISIYRAPNLACSGASRGSFHFLFSILCLLIDQFCANLAWCWNQMFRISGFAWPKSGGWPRRLYVGLCHDRAVLKHSITIQIVNINS
jgi:hypothetical protein